MRTSFTDRMSSLAGYGAGSFGANLAVWPISSLLLYFLTETVGFSVAVATVVITAPKIWDIFIDPMIGAWAGREASRRGNRGWLLTLAAGVMPAAVVLVFLIPAQSPPWLAALAVILLIVKSSAFMVFFISHVALADDVDRDGLARRDSVLAIRVFGQATGSLCAGALGPLLISVAGGGSSGYRFMAITLAVFAGLGMLIVARAARRFSAPSATPRVRGNPSLLAAIGAALRNRVAGALVVSNFLLYIAASVVTTFMPFMIKILLGAPETALALLYSSLMVAMLAGSALAAAATRSFARPAVLLAGAVLMTVAAALFYPGTAPGSQLGASIVLILWGLGLGVYSLLIFSTMMDASTNGRAPVDSSTEAGLLLGLLISTGKIGDSLGGVLAGAMLSWSGYRAGQAVGADTVMTLRYAYTALPLVAMLLSSCALVPLMYAQAARQARAEVAP